MAAAAGAGAGAGGGEAWVGIEGLRPADLHQTPSPTSAEAALAHTFVMDARSSNRFFTECHI